MQKPTENEPIVEEREEVMVSRFSDGKPSLRTAHFLKPTSSSIDEPIPKLFSLSGSSLPHTFEPEEWPLRADFKGWKSPTKRWLFWVEIMRPKYQAVWEKAGIFEAIMSSTSSIKRYDNLIIGLAEKWNPRTNTFIFPWGETTLSLEDVMILGGYSVTGYPVTFTGNSQELKEVEGKLVHEYMKLQTYFDKRVRQTKWVGTFMECGENIEHEAFLSFWLSRFVFPNEDGMIRKAVFPIACLLARGEIMALGPAVLASIYRDLTLLKETIVGSTKFKDDENDDTVLAITLWSPMQLLQLWAWERIPALQPEPNVIHLPEVRSSRWSKVKIPEVENVRMVLDSAGETFDWRPYAKVVNCSQFHEFYKEKEEWILVDGTLSRELVSFALCLRPSELVGFGSAGCIQQYLPHRVAMQFGIDQDVPCHVNRSNETQDIAWNNYMRPINYRKLYVPSRFFESDVTIRYLEWWNKLSMGVHQDVLKGIVRRKRSSRKRPKRIPWVKGKKGENEASVPPGFAPKLNKVNPEPKLTAFEVPNKKGCATAGAFGHDKSSQSLASVQGLSPSMEEAANIGSSKAQNEGTASANQSGVHEYDKENISKYDESEAIALIASRLEARVTRLETVAAELKAAFKLKNMQSEKAASQNLCLA